MEVQLPRRSPQRDIREMADVTARGRLDYLWAAAVAENDLAFRTSSSKAMQAFVDAVAAFGKAYTLPSAYKVAGPLLVKLKLDTEELIKPIKESWPRSGCTLTMDGWTCLKSRGMICVIAQNDTAPVIVGCVDSKTAKKTGEYLAKLIQHAICEVGDSHVVQVIMDNAANNKRAANLLKDEYPQVFFTNCAAHVLDLMLHDMGKVKAVKRVLNQVHRVVMMVKGSASAVTLFRELFSKLELVRPGATRFGTQVIMIERFLEVKKALKEMVISEEWKSVAVANTEEGQAIRGLLLEETFWDSVTAILGLMKPIYEVLRIVDRRSLVMGSVYGLMLEATVKTNEAATKAGEIREDAELRAGAEEVFKARGGSVEMRTMLAVQLAAFHKREGKLGSVDARWAATILVESGRLSAAEWWALYGVEVRALQKIAVMLLSQPVTSSEVERYWSALARVQRRDRNRLNATSMTDVAFVAFGRRARESYDKKTEARAKLYSELSNGSLQEGSTSVLLSLPVEAEVDEEEEAGGEPCTIDWDTFGNIGKRVTKRKRANLKKKKSASKGSGSRKGKEKVCEEDEEEAEDGSSDDGSGPDEPTKRKNKGVNAGDGVRHGEMRDGEVRDGEVRDGEVRDGEVRDGEVRDGEMRDGEVRDGEVRDGEMRDGEMRDGEMRDWEMRDGEVREGEMMDGDMRDGEMRDAEMRDGEMRDEEVRHGEVRDGEMRHGETRDGEMREGEMRDGEMRDGETREGEMRDGETRVWGVA
ncbi:unnamed protein product [Closterium sp. NIES-64]|nr:unnamed protein product [Closterium sp. NIES-64]